MKVHPACGCDRMCLPMCDTGMGRASILACLCKHAARVWWGTEEWCANGRVKQERRCSVEMVERCGNIVEYLGYFI